MDNDNIIPDSNNSDNSKSELKEHDRIFLDRFSNLVDNNLQTPSFDIGDIEEAMNTSHSTLYRKVKRLTGMTTRDYIKTRRLIHSLKMINDGYKIKEASFGSGFKSSRYFRMCFLEQFGMLPSEYIRKNIKNK